MHLADFLAAYAGPSNERMQLCVTVAGLIDIARRHDCKAFAVGGSLVQSSEQEPADVDCAVLTGTPRSLQALRKYAKQAGEALDLFICTTASEYSAMLSLFTLTRGSHIRKTFVDVTLDSTDDFDRIKPANFLDYVPTAHLDQAYRTDTLKEVSDLVRAATREPLPEKSVFLCYAGERRTEVRSLYARLLERGHSPWMDVHDLKPGTTWRSEIPSVIAGCRFFIACVSKEFLVKRSFLQAEIRVALEQVDCLPPGGVFLIPARLEPCDIPQNLTSLQAVDLFEEHGFERLCDVIEFK